MTDPNSDLLIASGAHVGFLNASDNVRLRYAYWKALDEDVCHGTVCLLQGRSEFMEKYLEVVDDLRARGFAVVSLDWRGQGGSQRLLRNPVRGYVRHFDDYLKDLSILTTEIVLPECPAPHFALAHSMGGMVLFSALSGELDLPFERVVLTAPMFHLAPSQLIGWHKVRGLFSNKLSFKMRGAQEPIVPLWPMRVLMSLFRLFLLGRMPLRFPSGIHFKPFEVNPVTSDKERYTHIRGLLERDASLGIGAPSVRWLYTSLAAMARSVSQAPRINVPVLVFASGADTLVSTPAIKQRVQQVRLGHFIVIGGARHEVMQERDELRDQFWAGFDAFIVGKE